MGQFVKKIKIKTKILDAKLIELVIKFRQKFR